MGASNLPLGHLTLYMVVKLTQGEAEFVRWAHWMQQQPLDLSTQPKLDFLTPKRHQQQCDKYMENK